MMGLEFQSQLHYSFILQIGKPAEDKLFKIDPHPEYIMYPTTSHLIPRHTLVQATVTLAWIIPKASSLDSLPPLLLSGNHHTGTRVKLLGYQSDQVTTPHSRPSSYFLYHLDYKTDSSVAFEPCAVQCPPRLHPTTSHSPLAQCALAMLASFLFLEHANLISILCHSHQLFTLPRRLFLQVFLSKSSSSQLTHPHPRKATYRRGN